MCSIHPYYWKLHDGFSQDPVLANQRLPESHGLVIITFDTGVNRVCVHHACMVVCESAVLVILIIECYHMDARHNLSFCVIGNCAVQ